MNTAHKFWKKFVEGDLLKREKQLKIIVDRFITLIKIEDDEIRENALRTALLSCFEDLVEYMECRIPLGYNNKMVMRVPVTKTPRPRVNYPKQQKVIKDVKRRCSN